MTAPRIDIRIPQAVRRGDRITVDVWLDADDAVVGAVVGRLILPTTLYRNVAVVDSGIGEPSAVSEPEGPDGVISIAGVRAAGTAGAVRLIKVACDLFGPENANLPVTVDIVDAVATDGRALPFGHKTVWLEVPAGPLRIDPAPLPGGRAGVPYHANLRSLGGRPPYLWTLMSGTLPAGLTLLTSGRLTGKPASSAEAEVTVGVIDAAGAFVSGTARLRIGAAPLRIVTEELPPAAVGRPYSAPLHSDGGEAPIRWSAEGLPAGLEIEGAEIVGSVTSPTTRFAPVDVLLTATDSGTPPQRRVRKIRLTVPPIWPGAEVPVQSPCGVVVGRDLVMVDWLVRVTSRQSVPPRDTDFERSLDEAKAAIIDEMVGLLSDYREPTPGLGDPPDMRTPGGGWDGGGTSPGQPGTGPDGGPRGPGMPRPRFDRSGRAAELVGWYRLIDSWRETGSSVSFSAQIEIDGDNIAQVSNGTAVPAVPQPRRALDWSNLRPSLLDRWLSPIIGRWASKRALKYVDDALRAQPATDTRTDGSRKSAQHARLDLRDVRLASIARWESRRGTRWGTALTAAVAASATGWMAGWAAFGAVVAASAGVWLLGVEYAARAMAVRASDIIKSFEPVFGPDNQSGESRITLTPGAHRLTVKSTRIYPSGTGSPYAIDRALGSSLSLNLTLTPFNPERWKRLSDATVVHVGGIGEGMWEAPLNLLHSDLDILVAMPDGTLSLAAAKGDGSYAAPRFFAGRGGGNDARLLVAALDPIGRSSVVAVDDAVLELTLNDGLRGFRTLRVDAGLTGIPSTITALAAGDVDGDQWMEIFAAKAGGPVMVSNIRSLLRAPMPEPRLRAYDLGSHVQADVIGALVCGDEPAGTQPGYFDLLSVMFTSGEGRLHPNGRNGSFGRVPLPGLEEVDFTRQPASLAFGELGGRGARLGCTFRQGRGVILWRREPGGWQAAERFSLPFRGGTIVPAPAGVSGFVVASADSGTLALLAPLPGTNDVGGTLIWRAPSPLALAGTEGIVAVADRTGDRLLIFR